MPAQSKQQQKAASMALAAKHGKMKVHNLKSSAKEMYESMSEEQLKDFAKSQRKGKPRKKD